MLSNRAKCILYTTCTTNIQNVHEAIYVVFEMSVYQNHMNFIQNQVKNENWCLKKKKTLSRYS